MLAGDGKLATVLTGTSTTVAAGLAALYGVKSVSGAATASVTLDNHQRAGLFTQAAFLAAQGAEAGSHPVRRGKVVAQRLLCQELPPQPANVPPVKPEAPNLSTRDRFADHATNPCAAACHGLLDPPGFAFEHYDGIGAWRDMDGGKPVDASGKLQQTLDGPLSFTSAIDMMGQLAASTDVHACVTRQWLRFALGRHEQDEEEGSLAAGYDAFVKSSFDLRELVVALAQSNTFRFRRPTEGEVLK
jgi:hypothetical protein